MIKLKDIKGFEFFEQSKGFSYPTVRKDFPDGAVLYVNGCSLKMKIPYYEVFDENDKIKADVFEELKYFVELNVVESGYDFAVIYPIREVDIPDIYNYNAFLWGEFNRSCKPGCFLSYCEGLSKTCYEMYKEKYDVASDNLYFYFLKNFECYKLGERYGGFESGGFGIVYLGTSIGKIDVYNVIKDYKNVSLKSEIYALSYKDLFQFYELFNEEYTPGQRFDCYSKIFQSKSCEFLIKAMEKIDCDKNLLLEKSHLEDEALNVKGIDNSYFVDLVEEESLPVMEKYINYISQGGNCSKYGYFSMCLVSPDKGKFDQFIDRLQKVSQLLDIGENDWTCKTVTEEFLYKICSDYEDLNKQLKTHTMIHIKDCNPAPIENPDVGTGSAYEDQIRQVRKYNKLWEDIIRYINENPRKIILFSMDEAVYRSTFRKKAGLVEILNHVAVKGFTSNEILEQVLGKLKESHLIINDDFVERLSKHIEVTYISSVGNIEKYIEDLTNAIVSNYYSYAREKDEPIRVDCIPKNYIRTIDDIMADINKLHGLGKVKKLFANICNAKTYESKRITTSDGGRYHMVFTGNPGTGKTTVARLVADMYYTLGIIKSNVIVEKRASDMISHWSGGTPNRVRAIIEEAKNGVLFIDEAYGFVSLKSGNDNKGQQALEGLMQAIDTESVVMILAGYQDEMDELFGMNPGLRSRIGYNVHFDDYNIDDLVEILVGKLKERGYTIDDNAMPILVDCVKGKMAESDFGNVRGIEVLCQRLDEKYKVFVERKGYEDDRCLREKHIKSVMPSVRETNIEDFVGIEAIKDKLHSLKKTALYRKQAKKTGLELPPASMHMVFTGNPGTGKTTAAKLFAQELYNAGVIETNKTVMIEPKDLNGNSKEDGVTIFKKKLRAAKGGILFIDEAYALTNKGTISGMKIVEELLTAMIDYKDEIIFIFAGYEEDMSKFMDSNPGLRSRIGTKIYFPDYSPEELLEIFERKCKMIGYTYDTKVLERVERIIKYFHGLDDLGNARFVENLVSMIVSKKAVNMYTDEFGDCNTEDLGVIDIEDIPSVEEVFKSIPGNEKMIAPGRRTQDDIRRIIIHELGHAVTSYHQYPLCSKPDLLVFSQNFMSAARVTYTDNIKLKTESVCMAELTNLLAGRSAEIVLLNESSLGCSMDYSKAKKIANVMVTEAAMGALGNTTAEMLLIEAEKRATEIVVAYKEFIADITDKIISNSLECIKDNTIQGEDFIKLFDGYKSKNSL